MKEEVIHLLEFLDNGEIGSLCGINGPISLSVSRFVVTCLECRRIEQFNDC